MWHVHVFIANSDGKAYAVKENSTIPLGEPRTIVGYRHAFTRSDYDITKAEALAWKKAVQWGLKEVNNLDAPKPEDTN